MADFPTALQNALAAHYSPRADFASPIESRRGFKARVSALERAYGTKAAAAKAAGIDATTWSRWATGKQKVSARSAAKVGAAHTALLRAAKVTRKGHIGKLSIKATVACVSVQTLPGKRKKSMKYNGGNANASQAFRWFNADRLSTAQLRDISNAWSAGLDPDKMADFVKDRIADAYGARFEFEGSNVTVEVN
ncbi:hypothetical protein ACFW34_35070 [Streptomyces sp. NPDC058848]|uniref:hypothetical protein n=1 Tax=Streptomyces sp. NPDC058848 TaxID=3346650 RepID=UPI0036CB1BCA